MYVAYYLHWPFPDILGLEHPTRTRVIEEIGKIHAQPPAPPGPTEW